MRVEPIPAGELSDVDADLWTEFQQADPALRSPFFSPHFARAVGEVRRDAFVGILHENGRVVGYFPFQLGRFGVGRPLGGPLSDYQGLVAAPGAEWCVGEVLRGCGLSVWTFDHLLACQEPFKPYHAALERSIIVDVSAGYGRYAAERRESGSGCVADVEGKARRLGRRDGPVRFVAHTGDAAVFRRTLAWKSEQYRRTGLIDVFSFRWTVELLERIMAVRTPEFAGMASAVYAGDRVVATHLGMRSGTVWHHWFPAFDRGFSKFSPGLILLLRMIEHAPGLGLREVDMSKGAQEYKLQFANARVPIAAGVVGLPSLAATVGRLRRSTEAWVRGSPLMGLARLPGRLLTRAERAGRYR